MSWRPSAIHNTVKRPVHYITTWPLRLGWQKMSFSWPHYMTIFQCWPYTCDSDQNVSFEMFLYMVEYATPDLNVMVLPHPCPLCCMHCLAHSYRQELDHLVQNRADSCAMYICKMQYIVIRNCYSAYWWDSANRLGCVMQLKYCIDFGNWWQFLQSKRRNTWVVKFVSS
jgi:hypothetical protein